MFSLLSTMQSHLAKFLHWCRVVKGRYLERLTCRKVLNKGFLLSKDALGNLKLHNIVSGWKIPVKCKTLGTVFAAECPGKTTIKNKVKQTKSILKVSAHNKTVNYANALVANLLQKMAPLCGVPFPSHVLAVRCWDATLLLASWSHAKLLTLP